MLPSSREDRRGEAGGCRSSASMAVSGRCLWAGNSRSGRATSFCDCSIPSRASECFPRHVPTVLSVATAARVLHVFPLTARVALQPGRKAEGAFDQTLALPLQWLKLLGPNLSAAVYVVKIPCVSAEEQLPTLPGLQHRVLASSPKCSAQF